MNEQQHKSITVFDSNPALCQGCAELIRQQAEAAIAGRKAFHLALSGGSTPKALHKVLADSPFREQLDWSRIHIWFGDERSVPHDHPDSNYLMAKQTLLEHVDIPAANIHPMAPLPDRMPQAAEDYQQTLARQLEIHHGFPVFDLVLLGLGPDGHTASLFPGTTALTETSAWVTPVYVDKLSSWRLTLTYPVLENARQLVFLVSGKDKAPVINQLFSASTDLPAARLQYRDNTRWLLDEAAAQGLPG